MNTPTIVVLLLLIALLFVVMQYPSLRCYTCSNSPLEGSREDFAETLGTLAPQRKFYNNCINNCRAAPEFHNTFAWTQMGCHDECSRKAEDRVRAGVPDIPDNLNECHSANNPELCQCLADVKPHCRNVVCPFSKDRELCMKSCETSGLTTCGIRR